jgi:hypothetical protein
VQYFNCNCNFKLQPQRDDDYFYLLCTTAATAATDTTDATDATVNSTAASTVFYHRECALYSP